MCKRSSPLPVFIFLPVKDSKTEHKLEFALLCQYLIWRTFFLVIFSGSDVLVVKMRFISQLEITVPDLYMPSPNRCFPSTWEWHSRDLALSWGLPLSASREGAQFSLRPVLCVWGTTLFLLCLLLHYPFLKYLGVDMEIWVICYDFQWEQGPESMTGYGHRFTHLCWLCNTFIV